MRDADGDLIDDDEAVWIQGRATWLLATLYNIQAKKLIEFSEFEERLLDHKAKYFGNKLFPYVKQSEVTWKLYGPYANEGNLKQVFPPEEGIFDLTKRQPALEVAGGTVILRHWLTPMVIGVLRIRYVWAL